MTGSFAKYACVAAFLVMVGYAFFTLRGPKGISALVAKQHQIEEMERHNGSLAQENERIREHIDRLSTSPDEQELEIRQRLKLVHPGEKVYILNK